MWKSTSFAIGGAFLASLFAAMPAPAATFTVTNLNDAGPDSLRSAVASAESSPGADTITIGVTGTITLSSEIAISHDTTLQGPGAGTLAVSGDHAHRVFSVAAGAVVTMSGLTITAGRVRASDGQNATAVGGAGGNGTSGGSGAAGADQSSSGTDGADEGGAGISNAGTLTLQDVAVTDNAAVAGNGGASTATGGSGGSGYVGGSLISGGRGGNATAAGGHGGLALGGGVRNSGTLTIRSSVIAGNTATAGSRGAVNATGGSGGDAGAGAGGAGGSATVPDLAGSGGHVRGAGIYNTGALTVTDSSVRNNTATGGGMQNAVVAGGKGGAGGDDGNGGAGGAATVGATEGGSATGGGINTAGGGTTLTGVTLSGNAAVSGSGGAVSATGGKGGDAGDDGNGGKGGDATAATQSGGSATTAALLNTGTLTARNVTITANAATAGANGTASSKAGNPGGPSLTANGTGGAGGSVTNTSGAPGFGGGGGVASTATGSQATFLDSTIAGNGAPAGATANISGGQKVKLQNSIVAEPQSGGTSCTSHVDSDGFNIDDGTSCGLTEPTDHAATNPQLGPLQDNGGPTQTRAPSASSPAIDQGQSAGAATDQRGLPRPADLPAITNAAGGDGADIGAVELQPDADGDGIPDPSDKCPTQSDSSAPRNPRDGCPAPPPGPPLDKTSPVLSKFALSPKSFAAAKKGPSVVAAAKAGTKVSYKLSEPATTTFTVERKRAGHKSKGKCVSGRARHGKKPCTRYTRVAGKIVRQSAAGASSFRFTGRLNGHSLKPGSYRLVASARDAAGNTSKPLRRSFTIKRPRH